MKSVNIKYLSPLDHLRAYAVCLIIFYHGIQLFSYYYKVTAGLATTKGPWPVTLNPLYALVYDGHTAVSLFMVLSGFIFTFGAYGKRINYYEFLRNRFLRIYPLFILLIVVGSLFYAESFSVTGLLRTLFLFYTGTLDLGPVSAMFWTITVEFQFYLIFPLLFFVMNRYGIRSLLVITLLAIILRFALVYLGYANARDISYWTLFGRIDQFIFGMISAHAFLTLKRTEWRGALALSVILVFAMMLLFNRLGGWPDTGLWKLIWPTGEGAVWALFTLSYIKVFSHKKGIVDTVLSRIGELSYSMYLLHYLLLTLISLYAGHLFYNVSETAGVYAFMRTVCILLPVTIVISFATYNLVERPFLHFRGRWKMDLKTEEPDPE